VHQGFPTLRNVRERPPRKFAHRRPAYGGGTALAHFV